MKGIPNFCTLFDSNYLDKGLVLYDSLVNTMREFSLYILAMDDRCYDILTRLGLEKVVVISLDMFEDEGLKRIKKTRKWAEYCWTCTASLIDYVFETYGVDYCTYVDSDLYFYMDPKILIDEMIDSGCSVQVVRHGFGKNAKKREEQAGRFCVQFNTFKNDKDGRAVLENWKKQCRVRCSMDPKELGDQKYLTDWDERYSCVHVLGQQGGGIAPWNIDRYRIYEKKGRYIKLQDKKTKAVFDIYFYHFHHLEYIDQNMVNINVFKDHWSLDDRLVLDIYIPYLNRIEEKKEMLKKQFGFTPLICRHPGIAVGKKGDYLKKLKGKTLSDIRDIIGYKLMHIIRKKKDIIRLDNL